MGEDTGHPFENLSKEIEFFFHKLWFSPLFNFATQCRISSTFETYEFCWKMKETKFEISRVYTIRWNNIAIRKPEFVTNTQFF